MIKAVKTLFSSLIVLELCFHVSPKLCFLPWNFVKLFFSSFLPATAQVPVSCCHAPWVADPKCKIGHANRGVTPRTKTMDSVNAWQCQTIPRKTISTNFAKRQECRAANTAVHQASLPTHDFSSVYLNLQEAKSHLVLQAFWNWVQAQATNNEDNNDCHLYQGQSKGGFCCFWPKIQSLAALSQSVCQHQDPGVWCSMILTWKWKQIKQY